MKKMSLKSLILCGVFAVLGTITILAGCQPLTPPDIELVSGTFDTVYLQNEQINLNALKLNVNEGGEVKEVSYTSAIIVTGLSTSEIGDFTAKIKYKEKTLDVDYSVEAPLLGENCEVLAFYKPSTIEDYENQIKTKTNKLTEFENRTDGYYVGTDNPFIMNSRLQVEKIGGGASSVSFLEITYAPNVSIFDIAGNAELTGTALTNVVTVDPSTGSFWFKAAAEGKSYRISMEITEEDTGGVDPDDLNEKRFSHTVKVVKGFNAHNAKELSVFDNSHNYGKTIWSDYKTANGITMPDVANDYTTVLLHSNLTLTDSEFASEFFYEGDLRDWSNIYHRYIPENGHFEFIGNYFNIDATQISLVTRENEDIADPIQDGEHVICNSYLFFVDPVDGNNANVQEGTSALFKNFSAIGNGPRTDTLTTSGGIQFIATRLLRTEYTNMLVSRFITIFSNQDNVKEFNSQIVKLYQCKAYDTFSTTIFIWGLRYTYLEDSYIGNPGGPAIIVNDYNSATDETPPEVIMDDISCINSELTGEEGWFNMNDAAGLNLLIAPLSDGISGVTQFVSSNTKTSSLYRAEGGFNYFSAKILVMSNSPDSDWMADGIVKIGTESDTEGQKTILDMSVLNELEGNAQIAYNADSYVLETANKIAGRLAPIVFTGDTNPLNAFVGKTGDALGQPEANALISGTSMNLFMRYPGHAIGVKANVGIVLDYKVTDL